MDMTASTYLTNGYPIDTTWIRVQSWKRRPDGTFSQNTRWQWLAAEKLEKWFVHASRRGTPRFSTPQHYREKDTLSPFVSNFYAEADADGDDELPLVINSLLFVVEYFCQYEIEPTDFRFWFTGGRSFHTELPFQFFGVTPSSTLHEYWKYVGNLLNDAMPDDCLTLDTSIYNVSRMWRLPNSVHQKTGFYKIELSYDEIQRISISEIREMARNPRPPLVSQQRFQTYAPKPKAVAWWKEITNTVDELHAKREEIPLKSEAIKAMRDPPLCIQRLRESGPALNGTRNKCQIHEAAYSLHHSNSRAEAIAAIDGWTDKMEGTPSKHRERRDSTRRVVKTVYDNKKDYRFYCSTARSAGLVTLTDCQVCPLYRKKDLRKHTPQVRTVENVDRQFNTDDAISIKAARKRMTNHFTDFVTSYWRTENPSKEIMLYNLPPGGGKTYTAFKALASNIVGHSLYFAPRHELLDEHRDKFPKFRHVRSRSFVNPDLPPELQLCILPDECDKFARKRHSPIRAVCTNEEVCHKCLDCGWRGQFEPHDSLLSHEYLFKSKFFEWLTIGEGNQDAVDLIAGSAESLTPASWVTILDEPSVSTFIEQIPVTNDVLTKTINATECEPLQNLLAIVRTAIEQACNGDKKPVWIIGQAAFERIVEAAKQAGHDLGELVATAKASLVESEESNVYLADTKGGEKEILLNFVDALIECLEKDLAKTSPFNSPQAIGRYQTKPCLRLNLLSRFSHIKGPLAVLDACMQPELLSALTERQVNPWNVPLKMASDDIVQITDGKYGIETLWDKHLEKPKRSAHRLLEAVKRISQKDKTLLVTWKSFAAWLIEQQEKGHFDNRVAVEWFGNIEGVNAYEGYGQAILIGRPSPPEQEIVEMGQAIWANDSEPLNIESRVVWRRYAYRDADGNGLETKVREFADERLNMLLKTFREDEIIQAVHRIRPLLYENRKIFLLTNLPIKELPPKELLPLDDLLAQCPPPEAEKVLTDYDRFKQIIVEIVEKHSGVWSTLLEKSRKDSLVIKTIYYNKAVHAKFLSELNERTIRRYLLKTASELGLTSTTVVFGQNVRLKVWHKPDSLDETAIRSLYNVIKQKDLDSELNMLLETGSAGWIETVSAAQESGLSVDLCLEATRLWLAGDYARADAMLVDTPTELVTALEPFQTASVIAVDTETTGLDPFKNSIRTIQFGTEGTTPVIVDLFKVDDSARALLKKLLANDSVKIFHNAKFDLKMLWQSGFRVNGQVFDTMIAHQLLEAGKADVKASLEALALEYLDETVSKAEQTSDWSGELTSAQLRYAATDTAILLRLRDAMIPKLRSAGLINVATLEFDCIGAVAEMELSGMGIDIDRLKAYEVHVNTQIQAASESLYRSFDDVFDDTLFGSDIDLNLNSTQQLQKAFAKLGIELSSTAREALLKKKDAHPAVGMLLAYKGLSKLKSAFLEKYPKCIHPVTGRIHASYWQVGSRAGRFSCSDPNLQQVPRNPEVRACFVPEAGHKLVIADYSQIELRAVAEIAPDERMIDAYQKGEDLHRLTASLVKEIPIEAVTNEERQSAKAVNFGLIYGMGAKGLMAYAKNTYNVDMTEEEATLFRDRFFSAYSGIRDWHRNIWRKQERMTVTRTLSGRRRFFDRNGKPPPITHFYNTPVQGTAVDIVKRALGMLLKSLEPKGAKIIGMVHDEIILETPSETALEVSKILTALMEKAGAEFLKHVPVVAEARIVDSWAEK